MKYDCAPLARNSVRRANDYHLSHLQHSEDYGAETSALVLKNAVFLVLVGDHRKTWPAESVQDAFDYFVDNLAAAHNFSGHKYFSPETNRFGICEVALEVLGPENIAKVSDAIR